MRAPELLTTDQMARADRLTIAAGTAGIVLMERAGAAVAAAAGRMLASAGGRWRDRRICIVCGPGNNGGDGLVAARLLARRGHHIDVGLLGEVAALRGDAAEAARRLGQEVGEDVGATAALRPQAADLVIDALFGAGLARDLDGAARNLVERMNASGRPVLAVDVPSGIDGNTGQVRGAAVRAARTVTFFRRKPGHLLLPGRLHCGATEVADIGIDSGVLRTIGPRTFANQPALWRALLPAPSLDGHKYSRGHVLVVSGGMTTTGAARLSAQAALRAGAGLVTVASPADALFVHAAHLTAIMLTRCDGPPDLAAILADARKNVVILGPGLGVGEATQAKVAAALARGPGDAPGRAVVLDADALTSFSGQASMLAGMIAQASAPAVVTPHAGEFARLFSAHSEILEAPHKLEASCRAAQFLDATVVLKGPDTVVAAPDGAASIGCDLPPTLATAGSGDVLAGIVGGLLAQGMPAFEAASCGVWMHGAAARGFGSAGLTAEDLLAMLPQVSQHLLERL